MEHLLVAIFVGTGLSSAVVLALNAFKELLRSRGHRINTKKEEKL